MPPATTLAPVRYGTLRKPRPPQGYQGPLCDDFNLFPCRDGGSSISQFLTICFRPYSGHGRTSHLRHKLPLVPDAKDWFDSGRDRFVLTSTNRRFRLPSFMSAPTLLVRLAYEEAQPGPVESQPRPSICFCACASSRNARPGSNRWLCWVQHARAGRPACRQRVRTARR
jgi:hypothetical protein